MVKTRVGIIVIIIGIAWSVSLGAQPREGEKIFFKNDAGDGFYYEPDSIKTEEGTSFVTVRVREVSTNPDSPMREFNEVIEINCAKDLYRKVESQVTRNDGTTFSQQPSLGWSPTAVFQGSAYRPLVEEACKKIKHRR